MEKLQSNLKNMVLVLVGVALICGGLLAYINNLTEPAIKAQAEKSLADGIKAVLNADEVSISDTKEVSREVGGKTMNFVVYTTDKGTAVQSTDPNGFGGNLKVLVGFDEEGVILGYAVLEHAETPGLGAKVTDWFQKNAPGCIIGLNPGEDDLTVSKDDGAIDAITASTITSRSFLNAVKQAYYTISGTQTDADTSASSQDWKKKEGAAK